MRVKPIDLDTTLAGTYVLGLCAICKTAPARFTLPTGVVCCKPRASRCKGDVTPKDKCFGCGKTATKKAKFGFVCGSSYRGCAVYESTVRNRAASTLKNRRGEDPAFCADIKARTRATCVRKFGVANPQQALSVQEKTKKTLMSRYGVKHPMHIPGMKDKLEQYFTERYGVKSPLMRPEAKQGMISKFGVANIFEHSGFSEMRKGGCQKKYGTDYATQAAAVKDKIARTNIERYGVGCSLRNDAVQARMVSANQKKYGVDIPIQNAEIYQKSYLPILRKKKSLTLPSGRVISYQGYEDRSILRQLQTHTEDQLGFNADVVVSWIKKSGKTGAYYPDITIPLERRLIEVKSPYTFSRGMEDGTLPAKMAGCIAAGWNAVVEVWAPDGDVPLFEIAACELLDGEAKSYLDSVSAEIAS